LPGRDRRRLAGIGHARAAGLAGDPIATIQVLLGCLA
jgi:hypothetical protein